MPRPDPFDELGVTPKASEEEIQRAYRQRVVERHRQGVFGIVDQLRRAQRALRALSNPAARARHLRERSKGVTAQHRQLALLHDYKQQMSRDLERIGAENAARHAAELREIDQQIALEELRVQTLARRRRLTEGVRSALWLALALAIIAALFIGLRGG